MSDGATGDGEWIVRLTATGVMRRPEEFGPVYQFLASEVPHHEADRDRPAQAEAATGALSSRRQNRRAQSAT